MPTKRGASGIGHGLEVAERFLVLVDPMQSRNLLALVGEQVALIDIFEKIVLLQARRFRDVKRINDCDRFTNLKKRKEKR